MDKVKFLTLVCLSFFIFSTKIWGNQDKIAENSTAIQPPNIQGNVLTNEVSNPTITNQNYNALPACPTSPVCPNANNQVPVGQVANCPDACTVTRVITGSGSSFTITDPICPSQYNAIATYNSQPEYANYPNPTPGPDPIPNLNTYNDLVRQGYGCVAVGNPTTTDWYCPNNDPGYQVGGLYDTVAGAPNTVVLINTRASQCFCVGSCGKTSCKISCSVAHDTGFQFSWQKMLCTLPPGIRQTGQYTNASIVCSHVKSVWQPVQ